MSEQTISDPGAPDDITNIAQLARRMIDGPESHQDQFAPQPETLQFAAELSEPDLMVQDDITFGVFRLNQEYEQDGVTPVIIHLGISDKVQSGEGRARLNAFTHNIKRPIVAIDRPGLGASGSITAQKLATLTFDSLATNYLGILDELGIGQFDEVGLSTGAVLASKIAEAAGDRVEHLVTFSAPSFEKKTAADFLRDSRGKNGPAYKDAVESAPESVQEEIQSVEQNRRQAHANSSPRAKTKSFLAVMKYVALLRDAHMSGLSERLAPATKWSDITGSEDAFSNWQAHVREIQDRNKQNPGSSSVTVLGKETHAWLAVHRWEMAAHAAHALEK